ncbi:MAG: hypothetical protein ACRDSR_27555 [Pseudonocardiaceae bacterium]
MRRACTGLSFREEMLEQLRPGPADVLYNPLTGVYLHLNPTPRAVPLIDEQRCAGVRTLARWPKLRLRRRSGD